MSSTKPSKNSGNCNNSTKVFVIIFDDPNPSDLPGFFFGQNRITQFPIFKTQFRFFGQKTQLFLKNSAKTYEKTQFWVEKLSYFGENSVQKGQNSVFQKNQKRKKRDKCPKIKPAFVVIF